MATHSSIVAWKISWIKEPGVLQSVGSQSQTRLSKYAPQWGMGEGRRTGLSNTSLGTHLLFCDILGTCKEL